MDRNLDRNSPYRVQLRKLLMKDHVFDRTKGKVDKKLERSEPYRMFRTSVFGDLLSPPDDSIMSFPELLDKSLGTLVETLHISFNINLVWLLIQYQKADLRRMKKTLIYSECNLDIDKYHSKKRILEIAHKKIISRNRGYQHSNVSMFAYTDGSLRVVVMSSNLCYPDWYNVTQGIWVSPRFPLKEKDNKSDGNSKTDFKIDILRYLRSFGEKLLIPWIQKIEKVDFSQANVFFIPSVPGKHKEKLWGHLYLKSILKKHARLPFNEPADWPIIAQCPSLGYLGTTDKEWLIPEFIESLSASTNSSDTDTDNDPIPFNLIFPTNNDVMYGFLSHRDYLILTYREEVYKKQMWLNNYMHIWKCNSRNRSESLPKIKTYCRISSCLTQMSWFLLTSANLSKGAWGRKLNSDDQNNSIMAYEAGILFLPQFLIGSDTFPIGTTEENKLPNFPLPFDLPLDKYDLEDDEPFFL